MGTTTTRSSAAAKGDARSGNPARRARATYEQRCERLNISPEVGAYLKERGIPLPKCPPKVKTPEPRDVKGAAFSFDAVDKVMAAFRALRHVSGDLAGQPLVPDPWQVAYIIAPVFGWLRWDDEAERYVRVIRDLYVDVPRKNGKSTLCAGIAIYLACADGEKGAQVVTAATTEKQAGYVFNPIKTLAENAPALKKRVEALAKKVVHTRTASIIEVVTSSADALHGGNIHGGIIDELHVHKTADLVETIETGRGSRSQPLVVIITTADAGKPGTIYDRKRREVERLAQRIIKDPAKYGVVWAADEGDDPFAESTWKKANPGYGISPRASALRAAATSAKNSPAELASFLRLHLGIRTKQETRFITLRSWDENAGPGLYLDKLAGRVAYGGLDLASTSDMTALCWLLPRDDKGFDALWRVWVPEAAMEGLDKATAGQASVWVREGWLETTPGNVTDYGFVRAAINRDANVLDVQSIGFDPWNSSQLSIDLQGDGFEMVKVRQGFGTMSAPLKEIQRLLLQGMSSAEGPGTPMLRHGANPVMRWMVDNLSVATDPAGNVKPDKAKSADKIDGVSALVTAMSEAMKVEPVRRSVYAHGQDLRVV